VEATLAKAGRLVLEREAAVEPALRHVDEVRVAAGLAQLLAGQHREAREREHEHDESAPMSDPDGAQPLHQLPHASGRFAKIWIAPPTVTLAARFVAVHVGSCALSCTRKSASTTSSCPSPVIVCSDGLSRIVNSPTSVSAGAAVMDPSALFSDT